MNLKIDLFSDAYFLEKAISLALEGVKNKAGGPFGAIIVKNNEIIAEGNNQVLITNDPTAHAEMVALRAACQKLKNYQLTDCILYSSCEPCPMCLGAFYWARPSKIIFACSREDATLAGFDDEFIYQELLLPLDKRNLTTSQILLANRYAPFIWWKEWGDKNLA